MIVQKAKLAYFITDQTRLRIMYIMAAVITVRRGET